MIREPVNQQAAAGQTLPSPDYLQDDVRYFRSGPEFKVPMERDSKYGEATPGGSQSRELFSARPERRFQQKNEALRNVQVPKVEGFDYAVEGTVSPAVPAAPAFDSAPIGNQSKSKDWGCLLYTSPSPRDQRGSRMPSSA